MVPLSTVSEPYTERESQLIVILTAGILFLEGLVIAYQWYLRNVNQTELGFSSFEWAVYIFGSFLVEPILLFGALYYVGSRFDQPVPWVRLLPGLVGAVAIGSILGQIVGGRIWFPPLHLHSVMNAGISLDLQSLLYWRDTLEPLARDSLTAVAALGLARMRHINSDRETDRNDQFVK